MKASNGCENQWNSASQQNKSYSNIPLKIITLVLWLCLTDRPIDCSLEGKCKDEYDLRKIDDLCTTMLATNIAANQLLAQVEMADIQRYP